MTVEQRIEILEQELEKLRGKPVVYASNLYSVVRKNCKAYFESVKLDGQNYEALEVCEGATRKAIRAKYSVMGRSGPATYIDTEENGKEYVDLFKAFLTVYQRYLQQE